MTASQPNADRPEVSVIVSVLNGERFIDSISDYLERQTFKDLEVIFIISSKCCDSSLEKARESAAGMRAAKVFEYPDTGELGGSKNYGKDRASGRCLWFLDVDDYPSVHYLEEMVAVRRRSGAQVVGCNFIFSSERSPFEEDDGRYQVLEMTGSEAAAARSTEKYPVASWSMLYDTDFVRSHGIDFEEGICEDIGFTYRTLLNADKVCYCTKPLYKYMITPGSVCNSRQNRDRRGRTEIRRYDSLEEYVSGREGEGFLRKRFALLRIRSAGHMTFGSFYRYVKSPEYLDMLKRTGGAQVLLEGGFQWLFPSLYFLMIRYWFAQVFYRSGKRYTKPVPIEEPSHRVHLRYQVGGQLLGNERDVPQVWQQRRPVRMVGARSPFYPVQDATVRAVALGREQGPFRDLVVSQLRLQASEHVLHGLGVLDLPRGDLPVHGAPVLLPLRRVLHGPGASAPSGYRKLGGAHEELGDVDEPPAEDEPVAVLERVIRQPGVAQADVVVAAHLPAGHLLQEPLGGELHRGAVDQVQVLHVAERLHVPAIVLGPCAAKGVYLADTAVVKGL